MDDFDFSSALKHLDDMDSELYSGSSIPKTTEMKTTRKDSFLSNASEENFDDFDVDDEDLADLLNDDDDDSVLKKQKSLQSHKKDVSPLTSPQKENDRKKSLPSKEMSANIKKVFNLDSSPERSPEETRKNKIIPPKPETPKKTTSTLESLKKTSLQLDSPNKASYDSLSFLTKEKQKPGASSTLENESDLPSPKKTAQKSNVAQKIDLFMEEESKYLNDLDLDKLDEIGAIQSARVSAKSVESSKKVPSKKSDDIEFDDDDDILDTLDKSDGTSSSKKSKSSFMDDLFGSPKEPKKSSNDFMSILDEKYKKTEKAEKSNDDDLAFGGYVPSSSTSQSAGTRRKSVKFDDELSSFRPSTAENALPRRPRSEILKKEDPFNVETKPPVKKSDEDWLGILKKDVNAEALRTPPHKSSPKEKPQIPNEQNLQRRKSSSAEWLGLNLDESPKLSPINSPKAVKPLPQYVENKHADASKSDKKQTMSPKSQLPWLSDTPATKASSVTKSAQPPSPHKQSSEVKPPTQTATTTQHQQLPVVKSVQNNDVAIMNNELPDYREPNPLPVNMYIGAPMIQNAIPSSQISSVPQSHLVSPTRSENSDILALQTLLTTVQFEKDQLQRAIESMKRKQEEDFNNFQNTLENQKKMLAKIFEQKLENLKEQHEADLVNLKRQLSSLEDEKKRLSGDSHVKVENIDKDYRQQIQKLKELHNEAVSMMKRDHEEALDRLRKLKDQEVEAISSNEKQARSLRLLSEQLEARVTELASLQAKVDGKHDVVLQEKQDVLLSKEKELKALERHLRWQLEEGEQERSRLQQLVLRLEQRLQQQTKEGEEDHWKVQQQIVKLEIHQKYLEEEKKMHLEAMEKEKEKLRQSQASLLVEQKNMMMQIGQERQQLIAEKTELEALTRRLREDESRLNMRKMKEESMLAGQRSALMHEEDKLHAEREMIKQESQQLYFERQGLEREKRLLNDEKEKVENMKIMLKRRSDEVEDMAMRIKTEKEDAKAKLAAAQQMESSHHLKMSQFTQQMQSLVEKEKALLEEKEKLADYKKELEEKKNSMLCASCKLAIGLPMTELPQNLTHVKQNLPFFPAVSTVQAHPAVMDPALLVWYMSAQKDQEYIQGEQAFLQSLKDLHKTWKK